MYKNFYLLVSLLFLCQFALQSSAQDVNLSSKKINEKFKNFSCPEKVYIHTDRDFYIAGENMFFKSYISGFTSDEKQIQSNIIYLVLRDEKSNIETLITYLKNGSSSGHIYLPDTLKTGKYELVAFTNFMRNFDESCYFKKNFLIVNRFDKTLPTLQFNDTLNIEQSANLVTNKKTNVGALEIILIKDSFKTRENIKIGLKLKTEGKTAAIANLSVTVKEANFLFDNNFDIVNLLNENKNSVIDIKKKKTNDTIIDFYPLERNGIYLRGKIKDKTNQQIKNECLVLSSPDSIANFQYTFSDAVGNFQFLVNNYYLGKEVYIKPLHNQISNPDRSISIEDKFTLKESLNPAFKVLPKYFYNYITYSQQIVYIQKSYPDSNAVNNREWTFDKIIIPRAYFSPYLNYNTKDYIQLNDFNDIVTNIIMRTKLEKVKNTNELFVFDPNAKEYRTTPAIIFVDGVPIDNADKILSFSSDDVDKIALCLNSRILGNLELNGLVSINTKKNKLSSIVFNSPVIKYKLDRIADNSVFKPTNYSTTKIPKYAPDFRQLLYWNPNVSINNNETANVDFFASDCVSDYVVEVKGILTDGTPICAYAKIKVYR